MTVLHHKGKSGFVLGKFMPLHAGHQRLIDFAKSECSGLTVMVGSLGNEPIPGELRFQWIKRMNPDISVVHCTDENPQTPEEHSDFWAIWINSIRKYCDKPIDIVFSSEDYGFELAKRLNAEHKVFDINRHEVPVSGTMIRSNPLRYWEYLSPPARAYYAKRVVITGPESTGKTELAKRLANYYKTSWVPEYGWEYVDRINRPLVNDDFVTIARGHIESEDRLAEYSNRVLICDTDLMVTRFFSEIITGSCDNRIIELENQRRYDLHLVLDTDVPYVAHPQRNHPHLREYLKDRFIIELTTRNCPFRLVSGNWEERFRKSVVAIDGLL